ncbi:hypothetical protein J6590_098007 [Homalodisca vitripennis]|nr:hypothetical protein J6590_098007 [Homalodisca vitripennis]
MNLKFSPALNMQQDKSCNVTEGYRRRVLGEVIVQLWAKVRKAPPPKLMLDSGKVKQVTMADTALRDLLPKLELLDQEPRLTQRKHLVDHATCQDPAYIFHGGQTDSISEGVLQSLNPICVSPRDTVAVCRIAVIKYRQNKRAHKPELSGFWQQTSKSVQTPQPTKGTLDSMRIPISMSFAFRLTHLSGNN